MPMNNDTEQAQKHTPPAPGRVNMSSNTFSPAINLGLNLVVDGGKGFGRVRKKFKSGIGFRDDLTAGLVEEWNRVVDGARDSLD
jgi:hypothetical protein